ncbi:MAG: PmeII family type II restriction endonuclease [Solirubrobacterales bacterium]
MALDKGRVTKSVRKLSGLKPREGPSDKSLFEAVESFVEAFDYWYIRVMREAVPAYRKLIVMRINPFVRRIEFDGMDLAEATRRLVEDYNSRNFVTAGGWAIEALAAAGPEMRKSGIAGIDLDRFDPNTGEFHLYVLKSGLVTRNSDIINALKRNARTAEKQLRQSKTTKGVRANYAIAAGRTTSTFEDAVWRPSSAEFWGEVLQLPEEKAVDLALAIAAEAGRLVRRDATDHIEALKVVVGDYIASRNKAAEVDWEYIATRNMRERSEWADEDKARHKRAMDRLAKTGYVIEPKNAS